jgi:hypothetical protein
MSVHHKSPERQSVGDWLVDYDGENVTPIQPQSPAVPVSAIPLPNGEDDPEECVVVEHAWIPEGKYCATYIGHDLKKKYRGYDDKLVIEFSIVQGDYSGEIVRGFFIIKILADYKYSAQGGSRWVTEMRSMFPELGRKRSPTVSLLKGRVIEIQVRDSRGKGNKPLAEEMRYSVVKKMLRVVQ